MIKIKINGTYQKKEIVLELTKNVILIYGTDTKRSENKMRYPEKIPHFVLEPVKF